MARPLKESDQSSFVGQVAAEIRRRRLRAKLTVDDAAAAAGTNVQTWYNWERARNLPLKALPAIAAALGCPVEALVREKKS